MAGTLTYFGTSNLIGIAGGCACRLGVIQPGTEPGLCGGDEAAAENNAGEWYATRKLLAKWNAAIPTVGDIMNGIIDSVAVAYSEPTYQS